MLTFSNQCLPQTQGSGCLVEEFIYTTYLGNANVDGSQKRIYSDNVNSRLAINYTNNANENKPNYKCGPWVNEYDQGNYYDSTIPPNGANVIIPAEHDIKLRDTNYGGCVKAPTLNATHTGGYGLYIMSYQNNLPKYCLSVPANMPIDDYFLPFLLFASFYGFNAIRKTSLISELA
ncbi:hypothetical protein [Pedobacter mucosus]|uniref:hypothetical protein n=1 Tax=Pedobacter mucosus TaxID=2895286 RepID=UPI001EE42770|nr:hypothetical protein [Pedobacter mucosus]UKT64412.1 hypothetical protein LOK61_01230 [Pedobacter mucosus]